MKLCTAAEMRALEERAAREGQSPATLMEEAGLGVAQEVWITLGAVPERKVVVLVLILWTAVSAVLCIIYFFILGAAALRRRTYSGRLFWLSLLSLGPIT